MRLWREIYAQLEEDGGVREAFALRYTVSEGAGGYFENVKSIGAFSETEIVLLVRGGSLKVTGENLCVRKYCESDVLIGGKIRSVELEKA